MKPMNRIIILTILFVAVSTSILRAEEVSLGIDEVVAIALRDNRDILLKTEEVKKARAKIKEAQAAGLPSIDLTGSWIRTQEYYSKDFSSVSGQAGLEQAVYQGGEIINTIRYNKEGLEVTEALLDKAQLEVVNEVKKTFYTLMLADNYAGLNKEMLDNVNEHIEALRSRYNNGEASEQELLKIGASLDSIRQAYQASLNQLESSRLLLTNLLYMDKEIKIIPEAKFEYTPEEVAYDEALLRAMGSRPEIRQYEAQEKQAKSSVEIAKAGSRPTVSASWDYYNRSHVAAGTERNWNDYNIIGVTVSWPIFDGWLTKAKVEQAIVDLKEAQLAREKLGRDIALEVKNTYLALQNAISKLKATESDAVFYEDNLSSVRAKYQQGIASHLDLSDAVLKYDIASFNKDQAVYDYLVARIDFEKAAGGRL